MQKFINNIYDLTKLNFHRIVYKYLTQIYSIIFFVSFLGITLVNQKYIHYLSTIIHLYVGIVLIIRFNPYTKNSTTKKEKEYDRRIAYSAGILLLMSTTFSQFFQQYIKDNLDELIK